MDKLQIFNYDGKDVRTVDIDGESWWVAKDVCDIFGETNRNRAMQSLDEDEKGYTQMNTPGGIQNIAIVNESGLYSLLFSMQPSKARGVSDEYIAERIEKLRAFRRWVTHEVLPSIRKTGTYSAKGYPRKSTSAGEVASLLKPIERAMIAQQTPPEERAATIQMICEQFGIILLENFVKPSHHMQMRIIDYAM